MVEGHTSTARATGWFAEAMASSDFCYSPPGAAHGDSDRYLPAVLYGCIPVFVKDGEGLPFEEVLPWESCSLRLGLRDVRSLDGILRNVSQARIVRMRMAMWRGACLVMARALRRRRRWTAWVHSAR